VGAQPASIVRVVADELDAAWDAALDRYRGIEGDVSRFNVGLLQALRPRWGDAVRPDTSMFRILFTRPNTTGYEADERVEVEVEPGDRIPSPLSGRCRYVASLVRQAR
jgi:hypothetical protein